MDEFVLIEYCELICCNGKAIFH